MRKSLSVAIGLLLAAVSLQAQIPITQIPIPTPRTINPQSVALAADGKIWFTDRTFRQVGFITPIGEITRFALIDSVDATNEVRPLSISSGPDGNMWFTLFITNSSGSPINRSAVAKVTPAGQVTIFPMPTGNACRDFFGTSGCGITTGPDGNIWYVGTEARLVGRVTPAGQITEFPVATGGSFMLDIVVGPDGNLWSAARVSGTVVRITPAGAITTFPIPGTATSPWGVAAGVDGNLWVAASGINSILRVTPDGVITPFAIPTPNSGPTHIVQAADGMIYFTEGAPSAKKIARFDSKACCTFEETAVPGGFNPFEITAAPLGPSSMGVEGAVGNSLYFNALPPNPPFDYELFKFTISVTVPPPCKLTCPENIVAFAAAGETGVRVSFSPQHTGECSAAARVETNPASGSLFPLGTTTVTATSNVPGAGTCQFTVTVLSLPPPPPTPNLTVSKAPLAPSARAGSLVIFVVYLNNQGNAPTVADWKLEDITGEGLTDCRVDSGSQIFEILVANVGGTLVITPRSEATAVIHPGAEFSKTIFITCRLNRAGPVTNTVLLTGGGSTTVRRAEARITGIDERSAEGFEGGNQAVVSGRR